jgi:transcription elongation factor Elf1
VFILFGLRSVDHRLGISHRTCPRCGQLAAQQLTKRVTKFTLFFIPLFPVRTSYTITCTYCGASNAMSQEQAMAG